ncbi:MAG: MmgE/PrpD family protein [Cytophagaceae bacterium]|nr:MmgE/PrpD family protein [Gemmatimonadaceae bacterium]
MSRQLAEFAARLQPADVPAAALADTGRAVLDWLGSALAGALEGPALKAREVVRTLGASDDATVFAGPRSSAAGAALANGVATHILELDDVHKGSTLHAAAPVIPAALAVAEREHASGEAFLLAVTLGYEAALRVGEAVNPSHYAFWHPTGTAATFGAAVAAGSLLGLDAHQMLDALGSAGTQAAGLWEFNADGAMSKALHPGKAAMNGVLAADLARHGFTGATRILEGERGFFRATTTGYDASRVTDALGTRWKVSENCYKLHACCGHTHSAIDVSIDHRSDQGWDDVDALTALESVEVETYAPGLEIVKARNPATPYQAKFSLAYCVAVALLEGRVGLEQFSDDRFTTNGVAHREIAALLPRIHVRPTDELTSRYPAEWGTRITFVGRDGSRHVRASAFPRGNPENPVSTALLADKLRGLVAPRYDAETAERAIEAVHGLSQLNDMALAFANLAPDPRAPQMATHG